MRLGAPVFKKYSTPQEWVALVKESGYRAAYCPVEPGADEATIKAYEQAAQKADLVIAEVGAWSNPLSRNEEERSKATRHCVACLGLAEKIGARCCVNIAGSRGDKWDGPFAEDLTEDTLALIVESVRGIIDAVRPSRTCYALETMPWMYPDSTDSYERLIKAIDRKAFAVHFDPVNLVSSPQLLFRSREMVKEFIARLGRWCKSVHVKDCSIGGTLTVHISEVRPGTGQFDCGTLLRELERLDPDMPVMLEHLAEEKEYLLAAGYLRSLAQKQGVTL